MFKKKYTKKEAYKAQSTNSKETETLNNEKQQKEEMKKRGS